MAGAMTSAEATEPSAKTAFTRAQVAVGSSVAAESTELKILHEWTL